MKPPITASSNQRLRLVRRLARRVGRRTEGAFVVEGEDLVAQAIDVAWPIRCILFDVERPPGASLMATLDSLTSHGIVVVPVESVLFAGISELAHPSRVLAVAETPSPAVMVQRARERVAPHLYLDGVRDAGNVGTIVRSAAAFGAASVGLGPGCADPFGPRAIRAAMGATFRVPLLECVAVSDMRTAGAQGPIVALDAHAQVALAEIGFEPGMIICVGAERAGISDDLRKRADIVASIGQSEAVESLNAAACATIALYESQRGR